jgi:hypothetical protein
MAFFVPPETYEATPLRVDTLHKLLSLGALNKGEMFEICGWPLGEVEANLQVLIADGRVQFWDGVHARRYRVDPINQP